MFIRLLAFVGSHWFAGLLLFLQFFSVLLLHSDSCSIFHIGFHLSFYFSARSLPDSTCWIISHFGFLGLRHFVAVKVQVTHFYHLLMKVCLGCVCANSKTSVLAKNDYLMTDFSVIVPHRLSKPLHACFCFLVLLAPGSSDLIVNHVLHESDSLKLDESMSYSKPRMSFSVTLHLNFVVHVLCRLGSHTSEVIAVLVILFRIWYFYPLYY